MKLPPPLLSLLLAAAVPFVTPLSAADKSALPACNYVRFECKSGDSNDFIGARIEGSNLSRTEGFVALAEVKTAPEAKGWGEITFENTRVYRWLRFSLPATAKAKLGGVDFLGGDRVLGSTKKSGYYHVFEADGMESDRAIAADLFDTAAAPRVLFSPDTTEFNTPVDVTLRTVPNTPNAVVRFTRDGTWPTAENGETYSKPIHVDKNTALSAVSILPERGPSEVTAKTFLVRDSMKPGLSTAHLGNSLTGTTKGFADYARTAGYDHHGVYYLHGGALTRELWALATAQFDSKDFKRTPQSVARMNAAAPWDKFWTTVGKVDLSTLQPRDFELEKELAAEINFIKLFRSKSPDLQPWLYCEWVEQKRLRPSDHGEVPSFQMEKTFPALTWEESMGAMVLYVEELQHRLDSQLPEGKRPRVLPSALAMGWMKNMIDHEKFPGAKAGDFYPLLFHDQVHPANGLNHDYANGAYVVDMTWFSAFYRTAPEGKVLPIETTFTPEQARAIEKLGWDVIKNYPDCGLYEEGTQPCGKPEIARDGKVITLKSATPGVWFRYTLDGTTPTRTRGYVYCGVISEQPGIRVKAVAYKSGMADSEVSE